VSRSNRKRKSPPREQRDNSSVPSGELIDPPGGFSDKHVAPAGADGGEIPQGVRDALLDWFQSSCRISPTGIFDRLAVRRGYGNAVDVGREIDSRWGSEVSRLFIAAVAAATEGQESDTPLTYKVQARPSLIYMPTPLFLDALEGAVQLATEQREALARIPGVRVPRVKDIIATVNRLFARRAISFRLNGRGEVEWHGDAETYARIVNPALRVLGDPRLAGAQDEFAAALTHLRDGARKDREDAIDEAAKAVESAMKVVLDEHNIPRSGRETAFPLWEMVRDNTAAIAEMDHLVTATARLRNVHGGHGAGGAPRDIPPAVAEAAVHGAAGALNYLATLLPDMSFVAQQARRRQEAAIRHYKAHREALRGELARRLSSLEKEASAGQFTPAELERELSQVFLAYLGPEEPNDKILADVRVLIERYTDLYEKLGAHQALVEFFSGLGIAENELSQPSEEPPEGDE
jgi:hypothetical protein